MLAALSPLFGAFLVILASTALGTLLFRSLGIVLTRGEHRALAFLTGSAGVSLIVLGLAALHLVYAGVFWLLTALLLWFAYGKIRHVSWETPPRAPRRIPLLFAAVALPFFILYLFTAWAPEASPDGSTYHLGNVLRFFLHHGLVPIHDLYGALPEGLEMLFLFAFAIGRHSAAALVHFGFLIVLTILVFFYARRFGFPKAGILAALMVFVSPLVGRDAVSAYNDVAMAATAFGVVYFIELWIETNTDNFLIPAGLLAGFSFAIKYTGFIAAAWALPLIVFHLWRQRRISWRPFLQFASPCLLLIAPWLIKDAIYMHNPLSPFFNTLFPNPYISPKFETEYARAMASSAGTHNPLDLFRFYTVTGSEHVSFLGVFFALAPLGLVSLRMRQGRHLMLAALIFALPVLSNQDTRFLLSAAPCLALAIAMAVADTPFAVPALMLLCGFASWPAITVRYSEPWAWRLEQRIPAAAAWHRRRADGYLHDRLGSGYDMAKMVNQKTPPGSMIFCHSCPQQAYMERDSLLGYESMLGNALEDMIYTPSDPIRQPSKQITLTFPRQMVSRLRVSLAQSRPGYIWRVHEMRVLNAGVEVPRSPAWRTNAYPDPWEAPFAFDNNPVTRWSTEKFGSDGAFLEIAFDKPTAVDSIAIECSSEESEQLAVSAEIQPGQNEPGQNKSAKMVPLQAKVSAAKVAPPPGLRRAATRMLKNYGFDYLVITDSDYYADDFTLYAPYWRIRPVGRTGDITLYHIE
jgi:hypothetical protein